MGKKEKRQIIQLISAGIPEAGDGPYTGYPGGEVFKALKDASDDDMQQWARIVAWRFPKIPQKSVHLSAFFRYVYGCFEKQGCVRNEKQTAKMISDQIDWSKSDLFVDYMIGYFKAMKNYYGVVVATEMKAHRVGDLIIINNDKALLPTMLKLYDTAGVTAATIKAKKNAFSAYYWALRFLYTIQAPSKDIIKYAHLFFNAVDRFCVTTTVKGKVVSALNYVFRTCSKKEWRVFRAKFRTYKNPVIQSVLNDSVKKDGRIRLKF